MARKIYICCEKEKLEQYHQNARQLYRENAIIVDQVEQAELVLAIQPVVQDMQETLEIARLAGIPVVNMTHRFIPQKLYDDILDNRRRKVK